MYEQVLDPVSDSLFLSALFATLPVIALQRRGARRLLRSVPAVLSAIIGWLGVAVTGSDTSSNALFGGLLGKMISPQNLAIGAAAVGMAGQQGDLFREVLGWSLVLLVVMCVIVLLQSTPILSWMVV